MVCANIQKIDVRVSVVVEDTYRAAACWDILVGPFSMCRLYGFSKQNSTGVINHISDGSIPLSVLESR